jgi:hypothetical protein
MSALPGLLLRTFVCGEIYQITVESCYKVERNLYTYQVRNSLLKCK